MIQCIALDDEPLALRIIEAFCAEISDIELKRSFLDPEEAAKYLRNFPVDLIFLDIQMPDISGLEFYNKYGLEKPVIFTTAFSEFAVDGFNLRAIDYLLKPIEFDRFKIAVDRAIDFIQSHQPNKPSEVGELFVRSEYSLVKIAFSEIQFIETLDDYLKIHLDNRKAVLTKMNLKQMEEKLPAELFIRVHRSFILPIARIEQVRGKVISAAGKEFPIGVKFEESFKERFGKL